MTAVVRQRRATSLDDVRSQLTEAFVATQAAVQAGEPAVLVVHGPDLLGQGSVEDAAVATGLLGLMRAVVFEGARKGWQVNVVAVDPEEAEPTELVEQVTATGLTGQVLTTSTAGVGKVVP